MIKNKFKQKKIKRKKKVAKLLVVSVSIFAVLTGGFLILRRQAEKANHSSR